MDQIDKSAIRSLINKKRNNMTVKEIQTYSSAIEKEIIISTAFLQSKVIMAYMPIQNEVLTDIIIKAVLNTGKILCFPRVVDSTNLEAAPVKNMDNELILSSINIWEPNPSIPAVEPYDIEFVLTPGIAFDRKGNRIGFGKGYYDRFISLLKNGCHKIAPAYQFQVLDSIPSFESDQNVDMIFTENERIVCR